MATLSHRDETVSNSSSAGFQSWFKETYDESYVPLKGVVVDHMYVDVNSMLHTALRQGELGL
eukprot:364965-Chlamydomonas_euryale.AAC.31